MGEIHNNTIIDLIADDLTIIPYRPSLNMITGGVMPTILLQQVLFRWKNNGKKPFFKFKEPSPEHPIYKNGDSWVEELCFTKTEFDTALKKIGIKLSKKNKNIPHDKYIEYWITMNRVTYYDINIYNLNHAIYGLFTVNQDSDLPKSENELYINTNLDKYNIYSLRDNSASRELNNEEPNLHQIDTVVTALSQTHNIAKIGKQMPYYKYVNNLRRNFERYYKMGKPFILNFDNKKYTFKYIEGGNHLLIDATTHQTLRQDQAERIYKILAHSGEIPLNYEINLGATL